MEYKFIFNEVSSNNSIEISYYEGWVLIYLTLFDLTFVYKDL
jgi:hypothetical protein